MQPLKELEKLLFHQELKETYSAEHLMQRVFTEYQKRAGERQLRAFFSKQRNETEAHIKQLQNISERLKLSLSGKTCAEMEELIGEADSLHHEGGSQKTSDTDIMNDVQSMSQYQLAAYARDIQFARGLQQNTIAKELERILEEKATADYALTTFIVAEINRRPQPRLRKAIA